MGENDLSERQLSFLRKFRDALASGDEQKIVAAYDEVLDDCGEITAWERKQLETARHCVRMSSNLRAAIQDEEDEWILEVYDTDLVRPWMGIDDKDLQRIELAHHRMQLLNRFREALQTNDEREIVSAYDEELDQSSSVTEDEHEQLEKARTCLALPNSIRSALEADDDDVIAQVYDPQMLRPWMVFSAEETARAERALARVARRQEIIETIHHGNLRFADELAESAGISKTDYRIGTAKASFIRRADPTDLQVELQDNEFIARWTWPSEEIDIVALVWRTDRMPGGVMEEGATMRHISRAEYIRSNGFYGGLGIPVSAVYVRVFSAMRDTEWFYSDGTGPSSRAIGRKQVQIIIEVVAQPNSSDKQLIVRTEDNSLLPDVIVMRKEEGLPLGTNDGEQVFIYDPAKVLPESQISFELGEIPAPSVLRVFVHSGEQWNPVGGKIKI